MLRLSKRRLPWVIAAVVAVAVGAAVLASVSGTPDQVGDLERASEAGDRAQSESAEITEDLEQIAENLRAGSGLPEQSDEIHELTSRQRRSLKKLAGILRSQLAALRKTSESLSGTRSAVTGIARLGQEQRELLQRALDALHRLEDFAEEASDKSARFAWRAMYGARLAEDSQESFEP